jgi:hypothetical protein
LHVAARHTEFDRRRRRLPVVQRRRADTVMVAPYADLDCHSGGNRLALGFGIERLALTAGVPRPQTSVGICETGHWSKRPLEARLTIWCR